MFKTAHRFWKISTPLLIIFFTGCTVYEFPQPPIPITGGTEVATVTLTAAPTDTPTLFPWPNFMPTYSDPVLSAFDCDRAAFVDDVTVSDGAQITAGNQFQKIWRLQNTGSCIWGPSYQVIFDKGNLLGASPASFLTGYVYPGQTIDIVVNMVAPISDGTYSGYWKLLDPNGTSFGIGQYGNTDFYTTINVGDAALSFSVSHVIMSVNNSSVTANCPNGYPFTIYAQIQTTMAGDVTYNWVFSNGTTSGQTTISVDNSLTQTVQTTFTPNASGNYWAAIQNESPNNQQFSQVYFTLTCNNAATNIPPTNTPKAVSTPTLPPIPTPTPHPVFTPTRPPFLTLTHNVSI